ncbi:MAG TPA: Ku protein [Devosia sp.]|nr:Ku protein [Devosia sp.]
MPASRPIWKGQLRLSLVSINVEMFPAHKSGATTAFNQIHKPTGKRVHYQKVVDGVGPVEAEDIKKGYEYEKGEYVLLEDDELDAVKLETKKTLELVQFVNEDEIPSLYYDTPYFLTPADELADDAFRVVRDALKASKKVGLGQLALRGKEYLVCLKPLGKGMLLETLHYEEEIKKADTFFSEIEAKGADADLLDVATALIDKKTTKFDPKAFKDHYQEALRELIARKLKSKGRRIEVEEEPKRQEASNVIDLMAALKKSLESGGRGSGKTAAPKATAKKAAAKSTAAKKAPARRKAS